MKIIFRFKKPKVFEVDTETDQEVKVKSKRKLADIISKEKIIQFKQNKCIIMW